MAGADISMEASLGYSDYEGYPILFLYRHALELYIKPIVYRGAQLCRLIDEKLNTENLFKAHKLTEFLPQIEAIFKAVGWKWDFNERDCISPSARRNMAARSCGHA